MYPSTEFIIEDQSYIDDLQVSEQDPSPVFAQFFTSDKGPEEMGEYFGDEFKIFGAPNFARHGQPLLQAQRLINRGATVLAKRVVAQDSTLANAIILAYVKSESAQSQNAAGEGLYTDAETGQSTTSSTSASGLTNEPILEETCSIRYEAKSIAGNANNINELKASALAFADYANKLPSEEKVFPICLVADNGRGVSAKKFNITANFKGSKNRNYLSYVFSVIENSAVIESTVFTLDPLTNSSTSNLSLESVAKTYLKEVRVFSFDDVMTEFLMTIKEATKIEDINNVDILFGNDKRGTKKLPQITVANGPDDIDPSTPIGIPLENGSNGSFGYFPIKADKAYEEEMVKAFNGEFTKDIYDRDNILLDAIIDANYPEKVKTAIEELIEFRQETFFFRDLGLGLYTSEDIIAKASGVTKSRNIAIYGNSYDVIDEYSKKQITVTTGFSLADKLPAHFVENRHSPAAGFLHGFVFDEIIEGTVNFLPKAIPGHNQKDELFANRINFISYLDKIPTLESEYTTQEDHTGFSYINNTLAVQRIVREIRVRCPKSRYSFMEEEDLIKYQEDIQVILSKYSANFALLKMEYAADKTYEQNMIYYAILRVRFKKFVQAEVFRIIAINDDDVVSAI